MPKLKQLSLELNVFDTGFETKMCGEKLYPSLHVKNLGVYIDEYLNCTTHVKKQHDAQLCLKIVKTNAMLSKI